MTFLYSLGCFGALFEIKRPHKDVLYLNPQLPALSVATPERFLSS